MDLVGVFFPVTFETWSFPREAEGNYDTICLTLATEIVSGRIVVGAVATNSRVETTTRT